jgi:uncharacterized protein (UPF0332 family)
MNVEECFQKGLLKHERKDNLIVKKSIEIAKHKLDSANLIFDAGVYEEAVSSAYSSMFHAARALLFNDGVRENSHYGLYVYLNEKFSGRIEPRFISELNNLRYERHEIAYGLEIKKITEEDAESILITAEEFISAVEKSLR